MPIFHFVLKSGWETHRDLHGEEFATADEARAHARVVARELLRNSNPKVRSWRIEVRNEQNEQVDEVMFSPLDDRLQELPPAMRAEVDSLYRSNASLSDTIAQLRHSLFQVRATLARANGTPYLTSLDGDPV